MKQILSVSAICAVALASIAGPKKNVIDEVAWVIGDEAIFRSDVEDMYSSMRSEGVSLPGDPYCTLPERMAVEKLYLHQAKIDTIEAPESQVSSAVERRIDFFVQNLGSREKVEEYFRKSMPALKEQLTEVMRNNYIVDQVQTSLTKNVKATPNEVRKYFDALPEDSIPYIPLQVETQIVRINPVIPRQEIEDIKARLRDYADRVNKGESEFSTLAIMYSDDDGSSVQGGELGFHGKADFVPEFSAVAFNLSDPKKVSRIVETEYGYHIIQLIEKRGDQANFRHILLRPKVSSTELKNSVSRLDSIRKEIVAGAITFDEAARFISQDKDSRNNRGIMMNNQTGSSRFEMQELPVEIARQVEKMEPGDVSEAFIMMDPKRNTEVAAIVRLTSRIPGHRANLSDDYNMIKEMYLAHRKQEILKDWVEKKIKETYVHIEDGWDKCDFEYEGWIK
ncbi:MAG: peptidylprolyl isomerase [Bacteroidales bacterium]|nr:peptidylprolyl isomerase [Bacteroidales bacterium]